MEFAYSLCSMSWVFPGASSWRDKAWTPLHTAPRGLNCFFYYCKNVFLMVFIPLFIVSEMYIYLHLIHSWSVPKALPSLYPNIPRKLLFYNICDQKHLYYSIFLTAGVKVYLKVKKIRVFFQPPAKAACPLASSLASVPAASGFLLPAQLPVLARWSISMQRKAWSPERTRGPAWDRESFNRWVDKIRTCSCREAPDTVSKSTECSVFQRPKDISLM